MKKRVYQFIALTAIICVLVCAWLGYRLSQPIFLEELKNQSFEIHGLRLDLAKGVEFSVLKLNDPRFVIQNARASWSLESLWNWHLFELSASRIEFHTPQFAKAPKSAQPMQESELAGLLRKATESLQGVRVDSLGFAEIALPQENLVLRLPDARITDTGWKFHSLEVEQPEKRKLSVQKLGLTLASESVEVAIRDVRAFEMDRQLAELDSTSLNLDFADAAVMVHLKLESIHLDLESMMKSAPQTQSSTRPVSMPAQIPMPVSEVRLELTDLQVERAPVSLQKLSAALEPDRLKLHSAVLSNTQSQTFTLDQAVFEFANRKWKSRLYADAFEIEDERLPLKRLILSLDGTMQGEGLKDFDADLLLDTEVFASGFKARTWGRFRGHQLFLDLNPQISMPHGYEDLGSIGLSASLSLPEVKILKMHAETVKWPEPEFLGSALEAQASLNLKTLRWEGVLELFKAEVAGMKARDLRVEANGRQLDYFVRGRLSHLIALKDARLQNILLTGHGDLQASKADLKVENSSVLKSHLQNLNLSLDLQGEQASLAVSHAGGRLHPGELAKWAQSLPSEASTTAETSTLPFQSLDIRMPYGLAPIVVTEEGLLAHLDGELDFRLHQNLTFEGEALFRVPVFEVQTMGVEIEALKPGRLHYTERRERLSSEAVMEYSTDDLNSQLQAMWQQSEASSSYQTGLMVDLKLLARYQGSEYEVQTAGWYPNLYWKLSNRDGDEDDSVLGALLNRLASTFSGSKSQDPGSDGFLSPSAFQSYQNSLINAGLGSVLNQNMPSTIRLKTELMGDQKAMGMEADAGNGLTLGVEKQEGVEGESQSHSVKWKLNSSMKFEIEDTTGDKEEQQLRFRRSIRF